MQIDHTEVKRLLAIIDTPPPEYDINNGGWNNDGAIASRVHQLECGEWSKKVLSAKNQVIAIVRKIVE